MTAKVAVIVPCYNQGAYVREALMSVRAQTFTDWVCVIVNDASTDDSDFQIRDFLNRTADKRFYYHSLPENRGVSYARNYAIKNSNSDYILPLDGDDRIDAAYLEKTTKILESESSLIIAYTDSRQFGKNNDLHILPDFTLSSMCFRNPLHATSLFRRSAFDKTDGYRENMVWGYEDWDLWLQLIKRSNETFKIPEILFYVRQKNISRNALLLDDPQKERLMRQQLFINNSAFFAKHGKIKQNLSKRFFSRFKRIFFYDSNILNDPKSK